MELFTCKKYEQNGILVVMCMSKFDLEIYDIILNSNFYYPYIKQMKREYKPGEVVTLQLPRTTFYVKFLTSLGYVEYPCQ